jgi:hypothetical protein
MTKGNNMDLTAGETVSLHLPKDQAVKFRDAAEDMSILVNHAENVFALLHRILTDGAYEGHFGLFGMAALAERALGSVGDKECEQLAQLGALLRWAGAEGGGS